MTEAQVIEAVKVRMADIMPDNQTEVTTQPFIEILASGCAENFYMMLPISLLPVYSFVSSSFLVKTVATPSGTGLLVYRKQLPATYIRFIEFKCSVWLRAASTLLQQGTPEHYAQYNKYTFGGDSRPKVTLVMDREYGRCIEFYNLDKGSPIVISEASCAISGGLEDLPDNLIDPFAWYVASVVFQSMEELDFSKAALIRVNEFIQLHQ